MEKSRFSDCRQRWESRPAFPGSNNRRRCAEAKHLHGAFARLPCLAPGEASEFAIPALPVPPHREPWGGARNPSPFTPTGSPFSL